MGGRNDTTRAQINNIPQKSHVIPGKQAYILLSLSGIPYLHLPSVPQDDVAQTCVVKGH